MPLLWVVSVVALSAFLSEPQASAQASPDPAFLESIVVIDANPEENQLTFRDPDGESRTVAKGDVVDEVGARLEKVGTSMLVFSRIVKGGDGQEGTSRIIVRFDDSGKTKVREYRTVPDFATPRRPPSEP